MSAVDRLFQLHLTPPFDRLRTEELTVIAGISRAAKWRPGELIANPDQPLRHLLIIREGAVMWAGRPLPPIVGVPTLLFDNPLLGPLLADPVHGATGLTIARGHFFTIVNECPSLLVSFYETAGELVSTQP
jgi:hypothetical protein